MNFSAEDEAWMLIALEEAAKGAGQCSPNPCVGAVVVKDNKLIGKGYHKGPGLPHAEREAIAEARKNNPDALPGSTLYVTLEPCSTFGKTPPCTDGIIEAKIGRCIFATPDPNPTHTNAARLCLESHGIMVNQGLCEVQAKELIRGFSSSQIRQRPWVISKVGMSLDGRLSRPPGETPWLTNQKSRQRVQEIRSEVDAILIGTNTLIRDNPRLTLRGAKHQVNRRQPLRVVLSRNTLQLPSHANLFTDEHRDRSVFLKQLTPSEALRVLSQQYGVNTLLLEAGGTLQAAFFEAGLVDEVHFFYAPLLCSGPDTATAGEMIPNLARSACLEPLTWTRHEDDLELHARVRYPELRGKIQADEKKQ